LDTILEKIKKKNKKTLGIFYFAFCLDHSIWVMVISGSKK
jgi:hypothetical protein